MRFIILAFALIGVALYISNPQAFGAKHKLKFSESGRTVNRERELPELDFAKISDFGVGLYEKFAGSPDNSDNTETVDLAIPDPAATSADIDMQVLSAVNRPDLTTYEGQLAAIALALQNDPMETAAQMRAATQACLPAQAPEPLTNYFSGLVQVVAQTAQLPQTQQVESFKAYSAPLTQALKGWLKFMPEEQRAINTTILQDWAARPKELVACHLAWLNAHP